jgi:hypothetical protein
MTGVCDFESADGIRVYRALENAAFYLQPFVDAIQEKFGMCASILLAGPIGICGGKIGVQR